MFSKKLILASVFLLCSVAIPAFSDDTKEYKENSYKELSLHPTFGKHNFFPLAVHVSLEFPPGVTPNITDTAVEEGVHTAFYFPKVDQMSQIRANFTQDLVNTPGALVRVWLQFGLSTIRSESRVILNVTNNQTKLVGSRAAFVVLDKGKPKDIIWDDDCSACHKEFCLDDTCSSDTKKFTTSCSDPKAVKEDPYRCGIKILLAWQGTDVSGSDLFTCDNLPSKLSKYSSFMSTYDAVAGFSEDFVKFWSSPRN